MLINRVLNECYTWKIIITYKSIIIETENKKHENNARILSMMIYHPLYSLIVDKKTKKTYKRQINKKRMWTSLLFFFFRRHLLIISNNATLVNSNDYCKWLWLWGLQQLLQIKHATLNCHTNCCGGYYGYFPELSS